MEKARKKKVKRETFKIEEEYTQLDTPLDNPFVETNSTDYIVKIQAGDNNTVKLYLNSQILRTVCEDLHTEESPDISEITLANYQPVVVIRFLKFIYPGYNVKLKGNS